MATYFKLSGIIGVISILVGILYALWMKYPPAWFVSLIGAILLGIWFGELLWQKWLRDEAKEAKKPEAQAHTELRDEAKALNYLFQNPSAANLSAAEAIWKRDPDMRAWLEEEEQKLVESYTAAILKDAGEDHKVVDTATDYDPADFNKRVYAQLEDPEGNRQWWCATIFDVFKVDAP